MRKSYEYQVKYFMKDGRELTGSKQSGRASKLFINDIFAARRDVGVRGVGDFATRINKVFLDLAYDDDANDHHLTKSIAIDANTPFFDWSFPVISETGGKVSYSGNVAYKDGTNEEIPKQDATGGTILVPKPIEDFLEVMVVTDLDRLGAGAARPRVAELRGSGQRGRGEEGPGVQPGEAGLGDLEGRAQGPRPDRLHLHRHLLHGRRHAQRPWGRPTTSELTLILDPMQ